VFTASALQVRERTHRRGLGRCKHYTGFLGPLAAHVAPDEARAAD
jgi:hypothetical protein